jgi:hypothetical protein
MMFVATVASAAAAGAEGHGNGQRARSDRHRERQRIERGMRQVTRVLPRERRDRRVGPLVGAHQVPRGRDHQQTAVGLHGGRRLRDVVRKRETDQRGPQGGQDDGEQERAAEDLFQRAAVDRNEQHRRQGECVDELVERVARSLRHELEAPGEVATSHQPEDRQHCPEDRG